MGRSAGWGGGKGVTRVGWLVGFSISHVACYLGNSLGPRAGGVGASWSLICWSGGRGSRALVRLGYGQPQFFPVVPLKILWLVTSLGTMEALEVSGPGSVGLGPQFFHLSNGKN